MRGLFLVGGALLLACGGKSRTEEAGTGGAAGDLEPPLGGATASGGRSQGGGGSFAGTASATGGSPLGGGPPTGGIGGSSAGGSGTGATGGLPGGFSSDAERIARAWSNAVTTRCVACSADADAAASCIAEDGDLVPSPFVLICLSQLAMTEPSVAAALEAWAARAEREASALLGRCEPIVEPPQVVELPVVAKRCMTSDFGCPERTSGTACDGVVDCLSGEDEAFCGPIDDAFTCHHGQPFDWAFVCDGYPDCEFGEDELNCPAL